MAWKYENKHIEEIYDKLYNFTYDRDILKDIALKAYRAALLFKEMNINEDIILKFLNGNLEFGAFGDLFLATSSQNKELFSRSHYNWLYSLYETKLKWDWYPELQDTKLKTLMNNYEAIQNIALTYHVNFPDEVNTTN